MALKSVDNVDVNGFDDELSTTELLTLLRTLEIFFGTITEGQEVRTLLNLEILGEMIPLSLITLKNLKKKEVNLLIILWVNSVLGVKGMVM